MTGDGSRLWAALNLLRRSALDTYAEHRPAGAGSRRARAHAVYLEGEPERSRRRAVLERLAGPWQGDLTEAGIAATVRFLTEHWPAPAPFVPMRAFRSYGEDRLTVTGEVAGRPALAQMLDFWPPLPAVTPPLLALFVAGRPQWPEPSEAGPVLTRLGLQYGRNRAGVWAIHRGPATAVLAGAGLEEAVEAMVRLSGPAPSGAPAPPAPAAAALAPGRDVAESFLRALAGRDLPGVVERAHVNLFTSWFGEPFDEDFDRVVDDANARPVRWRRRGGHGAENGDMEHGYEATFADGSAGRLDVFVAAQADRLLVAGYTVRGRRVLGVEYTPA
jgi:hypothetical protein